jgi:hypothetical protein
MNCDDVRPALLDYVMEEVPPQDCAAISRHLETCTACSEEVGEIRQTVGVLAAGGAYEDVPQRIRVVTEPASWWLAFWRNPARLAFAGGAAACLAIAILALARTTVRYENGDFEIAFGAAASLQSPAAVPLPQVASEGGEFATVGASESLTRREALALIAEAVAASEARQTDGAARIIEASLNSFEQEAEANRMEDRRELAESFRYVQAAQVNMWKQQVENQQMVSALVHRAGVEIAPRP